MSRDSVQFERMMNVRMTVDFQNNINFIFLMKRRYLVNQETQDAINDIIRNLGVSAFDRRLIQLVAMFLREDVDDYIDPRS